MESKKISLIEGNAKIGMLKFAFPIFLGQVCQQLYNVVDAIVVGNYVGQNALAAVTSTGALIFLLVGFFGGMFSGVGVIISRYFGANDEKKIKKAVGTAVSFGLISGTILTIVGTLLTPTLLRLMGTPDNVFQDSSIYIRTYFTGILFVVMYNTACGIFQAVGDSKRPLYYLVISAVINVVLDILFVGFFNMGVIGAAIATVISQGTSAFLAFFRLARIDSIYKVTLKGICIEKSILKGMINIGLPSGIQNSVIAFANVVVQSSVNAFGAVVMAGNGAYIKLEGFAFIPVTAFSMAITTFVSQNIGAENFDRVKDGARFGIIFSCVCAELIGLVIFVLAPYLISIFGNNPEVIAVGTQRAHLNALFYFLLSFSHCISGVLRGAGRSKIPMLTMLICWCVIRVSYIKIATYFINNVAVVFWAYPITWFLSSTVFLIYYKKSNWLEDCKNKMLIAKAESNA
ncbi:MATE family efflux transporter [Clostridium sp. NSJ-6]|uniref:MATE family efflux transporter n=1 Tax=Clostridium hominis TaxID=2763036 RepID=A0ABR7DIA5_9CLOT|nr:MATE family efflux transporter [Clostridium hominis]MBC5630687.1 MATE family efflux transporter [Clostridium hominis]MDU2670468.1 MATE family efflux transporter [Clostridium sp.]